MHSIVGFAAGDRAIALPSV